MQENGAQVPERMSVEYVVDRREIEDLQAQKEIHEQETEDALEQVSALVPPEAIKAPCYPERRRTDAQRHVHLHVVLVVDLVEEQVARVIEAERQDQQQNRRLSVLALA